MNKNIQPNDDEKYLGDPEIAIERAEDEETAKETHGGSRGEDRPE